MSGAAGMDLRYPIGGLFTVLGLLIGGYGFVTRHDEALYAPSGRFNINLAWGIVMLVFGLSFLALAARAGKRGSGGTSRLAMEDPEGREIEARERALGLER